MPLEQRLNLGVEPDYVGWWDDKLDPSKHFNMYLIRSDLLAIPCMVFPNVIDDVADPEKIKLIEGIILDATGTSVFSGTLEPDRIRFTKTYSKAAMEKRGALPNISCDARLNGDGIFAGTYRSKSDGIVHKGALEIVQMHSAIIA